MCRLRAGWPSSECRRSCRSRRASRPASSRHPLIVAGAVRAAPFICYEIIFPDLVAADSAAADLIVNVTNDAWFGNTPGPYQHFRQAQIRAVETGLPVIRAANTGISGYIDAHGRIVEALGMNRAGVIDAEVRLTTDGRVGSALFRSLAGLSILLLLVVLAAAMRLKQHLRAN